MPSTDSILRLPAILLLSAGLPALAQDVISAQSGLVNFTQGPVLINGRAIQPAKGQFPQLREQDTLRTAAGRAELLLNPGVFLRVGEDSAVRMISNHVTDSRLELLSGDAVVEATALPKDNAVTIDCADSTVSILKRGLYHLSTAPAQVKVYAGETLVESGGRRVKVTRGKLLSLGRTFATAKFDRKRGDDLDRWSESRAQRLALANIATARSFRRGLRMSMNGWGWNAAYGMYTFIPMADGYFSPYGFYFWSPRNVNPYSTLSGPAGPSVEGGGGGPLAPNSTGGSTASVAPPGAAIGGRSLGEASSTPVSAPSSAPSRGVGK